MIFSLRGLSSREAGMVLAWVFFDRAWMRGGMGRA